MSTQKIVDLDRLASIIAAEKKKGRRVVHCHGGFDLLHIGHIRYLEQARAMGDLLVVTITPDRFIDKGPQRPAFSEALRAEAIASLSCTDYVAINRWPTAVETIRLLRPDFYVKGSEFRRITTDMTGKMQVEAEVAAEVGTKLAFTDDIVFSSTHLINTYLSGYPEEVREYLDVFRRRHGLEEVLAALDAMARLKVLVMGDVILDEYVYCQAIGKSSKDPVLAVKQQSEDRFAGGVLAVANHLANFAGQVELLAPLGGANVPPGFIASHLNPAVTTRFFPLPDKPTVRKRRYVEGYSLNKLLEIYEMDEAGVTPDVGEAICAALKERAGEFDLVLVSDFGHGAISPAIVEALCRHAPFLAVNTQANAGNRGFHTIARYPRADYVCIAEHEMRLEARDAMGELRPMVERTRNRLGAKYMVVTTGRKGCVVGAAGDEYCAVPAFAGLVVDRVGAGDAFLAVTSLAAVQGVPFELLGFIGNVVGAEAVAIVGNAKAIDKLGLKKHMVSLLK